MDLSALIFVALAVAWGVYLIPKALTQHEEGAARRPVEAFSDRMRVLARREPVDRRRAELVVPGAPSARRDAAPAAVPPAPSVPSIRVRRAAAVAATRRRRRVLGAILFFLADAVALAYVHVLPWAVVWAPAGLLLVWLGLCRVMVRREHAVVDRDLAVRKAIADTSADDHTDDRAEDPASEDDPITEEIAAVPVGLAALDVPAVPVRPDPTPDPDAPLAVEGWDPVAVPLPTYVAKEPAARRSVRTIDLDSTGVWTSGRTAADSALAREADEARSEPSSDAEREQRRA